jgi:L-2-hydroxyglutarate oxidase LhgO
MVELYKRLRRPVTLLEITREELREAQLEKLKAESAADYASSVVAYNEARIERLKARIEEFKESGI